MQLTAEQAQELARHGASVQVLNDYGSFKLVQVESEALAALPEGAEVHDDFNDVLLNAGVIDTASAHGQSLRGMKLQASGKRFHLVQFNGPIKPEWVRDLKATGVQVVAYIPNNAYLVYGDVASLTRLQRHVSDTAAIQWNADYLDDYKLDPSIHTVATKSYAIQLIKDEEANGPTLEFIRRLQSRDGTRQEALGYVNVVASLTIKDLYEIAVRPDVLSIQPRPPMRKMDERQDMIAAGQLTGTSPTGPGYLAWLASKGFTQAQFAASGFGVDVTDSGIDNGTQTPNHFGLYVGGNVADASRVVYSRLEGTPTSSSSTLQGCDGHGALNAHILAGYSNKTGAVFIDSLGFSHGLGVAPFVKVGASVVFDPNDFTDPDYEDLQSRAYGDGMRISSNSWGTSVNSYSLDAQRYDALVRDAQPVGSAVPATGNQEMVIVFSAGNSGSGANTVGAPGTAKNIITVGASENVRGIGGSDRCGYSDSQANNALELLDASGRGPTSDGRKKPDLIAPGTHVVGGVPQAAGQRANPPASPNGLSLSCFNGGGVCGGLSSIFYPAGQQWYTASTGTSHATPVVAGGAALLRQYFINQGMAPPSAAMTKAYLMNSARYMTGAGAGGNLYSNSQGMGLVDLGMAFDGTPRLLEDQKAANLLTSTGDTRSFTGVPADPTKPVRITLAWTDAPGSTTGSAWQNNLDLSLTAGFDTYKGNVFTQDVSTTGGTADGSNNVESVYLPAGFNGSFSIIVKAANITSDSVPGNGFSLDQDFALVAYNYCSFRPDAPLSVQAAASGTNRIVVSWFDSSSNTFNVYRATTAGGPYTRVGTVASSPFVDTSVSGGATYYYVVRAVRCAESVPTEEVSATATGTCTQPPTFAGVTSVTNNTAPTCANTVAWAAGTPFCGGTVTYSIYRGTTSGFTPSAANRIASGVSGTSFVDDLNLISGNPYFYVVRATEVSTATLEDSNTVQKSATPTGGYDGPGLRYFDDFDNNRPTNASAYWIPTTQSGTPDTMQIVSNCHYQFGTKSYRFGAVSFSCGGTYPLDTQATLSLGGNGATAGINGFVLPASHINQKLEFNLWYDLETQYDGAWLVYSTVSAAGPWTQVKDSPSVTAPYISAGGYDSTLITNPALRVWTSSNKGANGALKAVSVNLNALAGQTVWFGFKFYSDNVGTYEGLYLDYVRVSTDIPGTCTTRVPPPGPAVAYKLTGLPATAQAGTALNFTVTAVDATGLTATGYNGSASLTSTDAQAVLPATSSFSAGVANVPITFRTQGAQSVTATSTVSSAMTASGSTTVSAGPPAALTFTAQPTATVAGTAINPAVKVGVVDAFGNPITSGVYSVTLALGSNPGGGTLSGTLTATTVAGVATFSNLSVDKVGAGYTLAASSAGLTGTVSSGFQINPAAAAKLAFITQPPNGVAGAALTPAVRVGIQDAFGNLTASTANVTLAMGTNPTGAQLSGTTTVAAVSGVATFSNVSLDKVGTGFTLKATSGSLTSAASAAFDISPGAPHHVLITQEPTGTTAGAVISPAVQAKVYDAFGNVATQSSQAISIVLGNNPTGATLSGTTTVNAVSGVATFGNLSVDRVGLNYTLVAGGSGLVSDSSAGFDVFVGAPTRLAFTASPSGSVGAGASFTVTVAVQDSAGNVVSSASPQVTLALANAPGATLSGTKVVTAVNGVATFTGLSVDKPGSGYTLQASAPSLTSATSAAFNVDPAGAATLSFGVQPSNTSAGATIAPAVRVEVRDAQGNLVTSASASISLALGNNPTGATLSGTRTQTPVSGVATFSDLSVDKAGSGYTLQASSGALSATSTGFNVTGGSAARLVFRTPPTNAAADVGLGSIQVEIQDVAGNPTNSTAQVSLSLGGPSGGTLGGTTTVAAVSGVATFSNLFIRQAGSGYTLTASSAALQSVTSGPFNITSGAPAALAFTVQPSGGAVNTSLSPAIKVAVLDAYGNLVTSATPSITLALGTNSQGATLTGTTVVAAVNGVATFGAVAVNRVGTGYTLIATAGSLASVSSTPFDIRADGAARLAFKLGPTTQVAGGSLGTISVQVQDSQGNPVSTTDSISLTLQGSQGGTLSGTTTVSASGGVATFSTLSIARAGTGYQLAAHANGLVDALSEPFDITPGPAAKLVFAVQPSLVQAGLPLTPAIQVGLEDAFGNPRTSATDAITITLGNNPRAGTLSGTRTVNAVNGVATFSSLTIDRAATGYTLQASSGALPPATSAAFSVTAGPVASFVLTLPASVTAGQETTLSATAMDAFGNVAGTYVGPAKVTSSDPTAVFPATVTFAEGVLQGVKVTFKSSGPRTLTLTDSANANLSAVAQTQVSSLGQPTVSVTSPASGAKVYGTVNIVATGAVAAGTTLTRLSILVDGAVIGSGTSETLSASWDSSTVPAGSAHTITALVVDSMGNVTTSSPVTVTTQGGSGSGCGCGATSGTDASIFGGLLLLAWGALGRRRRTGQGGSAL